MKIRFTPRAYFDREAIFAYLNAQSPNGAQQVMRRLRNAVKLISTQPLNGRQTDHDDVRVMTIGKYPYKIFYRIGDDHIAILHLHHTARDPSKSN